MISCAPPGAGQTWHACNTCTLSLCSGSQLARLRRLTQRRQNCYPWCIFSGPIVKPLCSHHHHQKQFTTPVRGPVRGPRSSTNFDSALSSVSMAKHRGSTTPETLDTMLLFASTVGWVAAFATLTACCWQLLRHTLRRQRAMRRRVQLELSDARAESTACNSNCWDVRCS